MNSLFICVPLISSRKKSQTDSTCAGRQAMVGSEQGTHHHRGVSENPSDYPGPYSQSQKKTLDLRFGSTLSFICFAVLGTGGRGEISCSNSTMAFCLLQVITLAHCRGTGF